MSNTVVAPLLLRNEALGKTQSSQAVVAPQLFRRGLVQENKLTGNLSFLHLASSGRCSFHPIRVDEKQDDLLKTRGHSYDHHDCAEDDLPTSLATPKQRTKRTASEQGRMGTTPSGEKMERIKIAVTIIMNNFKLKMTVTHTHIYRCIYVYVYIYISQE